MAPFCGRTCICCSGYHCCRSPPVGWAKTSSSAGLTILYGLNLLFCALAYLILQTSTVRCHGPDSVLAEAVATDFKGKISAALYVAGILSAWQIRAWIGMVFFVITALMWLVPDPRMERAL